MIYLENKKNVAINLKSWDMTAEVYDLDAKVTIWDGPVNQELVDWLQDYIKKGWLPKDFWWKTTKRFELAKGHHFIQCAVGMDGKKYLKAEVKLMKKGVLARTNGWRSFWFGFVLGLTRLTFWEAMATIMVVNALKKRNE